jgi:hypothetical protein
MALAVVPLAGLSGHLEGYQGNWWLNMGLGGGFSLDMNDDDDQYDDSGFAFETSFNYMPYDGRLLTGRLLSVGGFFDKFYDISALYGVIYKTHTNSISASAGLGLLGVEKDNKHTTDDRTVTSIGVPLEIQAFTTLSPAYGVGLIGFGNLNGQSSIAGVAVSFQFGVLD